VKRFRLTRPLGCLALVVATLATALGAATGYSTTEVAKGHAATHRKICDVIAKRSVNPRQFVHGLHPGQTGCLLEGVYKSKRRPILFTNPRVRLISVPGQRATVVGQLKINPSATEVHVRDLNLNGRNLHDALGPLIYADSAVLRNNDITNHHTAICVHVTTYPGSADPRGVVIQHNRIHDCGVLPATNLDHGIYVAEARNTVIRRNLIYDNADRGVQLYPDADGTRVTGNVIDGNGEGVIFGGDSRTASDNNVVEHNVITNSSLRYNIESSWGGPVGTGNVARDNCTSGGAHRDRQGGIQSPAVGFTAVDNVVADPGYADAGRGDFRTDPRSACAAVMSSAP
jgi:parallel beta-helix repeat protein